MDRLKTFRRDFPTVYLRDCLTGLFEDYLAAAEYCSMHFDTSEAVNLLPFYRRSLVEMRLREIAKQFKQMKAVAEGDASGFWNHTVVTAGDCLMTQSTVRTPLDLVRSSFARRAYAEPDNQKYLFSSLQPATPSLPGFVYGILVHGRDPGERFFPAFAQIVFPRRNLTGYHPGAIDLFKEFPEVVRQCTTGIFEERHDTLERQYETISLPEPELRDDLGEAL
jgi:hypothetical protein